MTPKLSILVALIAFGMGCGGLSASQSVSPASFFLPGLGQNDSGKPDSSPRVPPLASNDHSQVVAFSRVAP